MSGEPSESAAEHEGQQRDKEEFQNDPRGGKQISDQQPEAQPPELVTDDSPGRTVDDEPEDRTGGDDPGQATGNPANAG